MIRFALHDFVELRGETNDSRRIDRGAKGYVAMVYPLEGYYEVEFIDEKGRTYLSATVAGDSLHLIRRARKQSEAHSSLVS